MASVNTQFSIAVHVLAALAHYEVTFTSLVLAGSVNANPVFVKRILVKLSKAKLFEERQFPGRPDNGQLRVAPDCRSTVDHGDVLERSQKTLEAELERTTLADMVKNIRLLAG